MFLFNFNHYVLIIHVRIVDENKSLALWESRDERLDLEEVKSIQDKRDKWLLLPKKTIQEVLESTQVTIFFYRFVIVS